MSDPDETVRLLRVENARLTDEHRQLSALYQETRTKLTVAEQELELFRESDALMAKKVLADEAYAVEEIAAANASITHWRKAYEREAERNECEVLARTAAEKEIVELRIECDGLMHGIDVQEDKIQRLRELLDWIADYAANLYDTNPTVPGFRHIRERARSALAEK